MEDIKRKNYKQVISDLQASLGWMDLVLANMGEGILVAGDNLKTIYANDAIAEMTGKSPITLLGVPVWEILTLSRGQKRLEKNDYQRVLSREGFEPLSGRYTLQGKSELTVSITTSFIPKINQVVFIIRDISQRRKDEQALMDERIARIREQIGRKQAEDDRQLLQSIIDGAQTIIYLKDAESRYLMVNREFEEVFGLGNADIKGKRDSDLFSSETAEILHKNDEKILHTGKTIKSEESISHKNGPRYYLSVKYPLFDLTHESYKLCGVLTDITGRKRLEESKNDFIKMVYHELNTPLTVMKLFLETTKMHIEQGEVEKSLKNFSKVESQLSQIATLTDDLLDAARMEKVELELNQKEFNITALVKETAEVAQAKTAKHTIDLRGDLKQHCVMGDKQRIGQVLLNLLTNAIKYAPDGGDIIIEMKADEQLTVSVQDFGIGISQEDQKHIFDRFYRGAMQKSEIKGLGMGLYVASEVIKRHGGNIQVKSEEGKGSTFSFTLPM
ncbi:MAG TPA: ATP-binding protein [Balneolaceae bacterium]